MISESKIYSPMWYNQIMKSSLNINQVALPQEVIVICRCVPYPQMALLLGLDLCEVAPWHRHCLSMPDEMVVGKKEHNSLLSD